MLFSPSLLAEVGHLFHLTASERRWLHVSLDTTQHPHLGNRTHHKAMLICWRGPSQVTTCSTKYSTSWALFLAHILGAGSPMGPPLLSVAGEAAAS